jgi:hypothetical protein
VCVGFCTVRGAPLCCGCVLEAHLSVALLGGQGHGAAWAQFSVLCEAFTEVLRWGSEFRLDWCGGSPAAVTVWSWRHSVPSPWALGYQARFFPALPGPSSVPCLVSSTHLLSPVLGVWLAPTPLRCSVLRITNEVMSCQWSGVSVVGWAGGSSPLLICPCCSPDAAVTDCPECSLRGTEDFRTCYVQDLWVQVTLTAALVERWFFCCFGIKISIVPL